MLVGLVWLEVDLRIGGIYNIFSPIVSCGSREVIEIKDRIG